MVLRYIKVALILSHAALLTFSTWLALELYTSLKPLEQKLIFEVDRGKNPKAISTTLKKREVIKKKWPFLLGYKLFFSDESLKAGEYALYPPFSTKDVLVAITEGKIYLHPLTIPEGLTAKETSRLLGSQGLVKEEEFLEAFSKTEEISSYDLEAQNLEGYLFPETYFFPKGTPAKKIISTMIFQFKDIFKKEWTKRTREIGFTIREVVILASLIEKETSISEEKKLVSAVFHNRLKRGMKLDCDPTIIYVLKLEDRFEGRLRTKHLTYDTPYNTYLYPGLPPGPICNPGKESLLAALYPAEEDYLYFVSRNDGSHQFSRTFREHQRAVLHYQKRK
ncbi:MAG: endolytic transglycosylase MltG [Candidatus Aminicenantaceae bacterium]